MLNADTKRHIDAARDVLVGVAPNPMTQIDQITYALIYKFMDDMDEAAIKAGGERSFFTGDLAPYAWSNLVDTRIGSQEKMDLFADALTKFAEAPQLPELFRTIFRAAFLPYRSPETLGLFIKEINYFDYSHPEELGNAYEYLLSIMSAQGDAGQFRTPRHIIDFMVAVLDPTKDDTILDPACGTGGFLVSSYNHILEKHDGKDDPNGKEKPLTPAERKKLTQNLAGYDIDPSMVRIAQVNMYLHQFKNPQIFQYDGLTSEERWNDKFDVILANPPFMSPKGGIKPHNKFGIKSNRAEVLFVDYIANHLRPAGRAAIVVPEGIIFQSGKAYKELRKNLVENGLYAVVSLPGGVFQPYSGVKTSILFINREVAKAKSEIAFIKISADGFDLGATKRVVSQNDLPVAREFLQAWVKGADLEIPIGSLVSKSDIAENGEYNLSENRYKVGIDHTNAKWQILKFVSLFTTVTPPQKIPSSEVKSQGTFPVIDQSQNLIAGWTDNPEALVTSEKDLIIFGDHTCAIKYVSGKFAQGADGIKILNLNDDVLPKFAFHVLVNRPIETEGYKRHFSKLKDYDFPLPPLEVQQQIVSELDGYAAIISGAKQIVENWKPSIDVDPEWPIAHLSDCCQFINGDRSSNYPTLRTQDKSGIPFINAGNLSDGLVSLEKADYITEEQFAMIGSGKVDVGDVLFCLRGSLGKMAINRDITRGAIASSLVILRALDQKVDPTYLYTLLASEIGQSQIQGSRTGAAQPNLAATNLKKFQIPLPSLSVQREIVEVIDRESAQMSSVRDLIETYEAKTQAVIAKLWSE